MRADLPGAPEFARGLNGHVSENGDVRFPGPGRKAKDRSCTLRLDAKAPDRFVVADARGEIDGIELKEFVRERMHLPFQPRRQPNSGNGKAHRPAGGPIVRDLVPRIGRNGEGGATAPRLLHCSNILKLWPDKVREAMGLRFVDRTELGAADAGIP